MAYWLKCWSAMARLQVQTSLGAGFFFTLEYTQLQPQNEELAKCSSPYAPLWRGEAHRSWLLLAIISYSSSSLATFGKTLVEEMYGSRYSLILL